ncbi:amidohydrolase family protein [Devosia salina]|uniref:Amidohydrolase family protein n=1 Tax=Devosia salina TaxID=2860336 RepID=A0ABX8WH69_9HYPH|nr:amidohydrolase family protein [Devosia salina]QYO75635.1 amidohydrolase family protein [Devosia salina]
MMATAGAVRAGGWDCAIHIYERDRPLVPSATFQPPHAPLADYLRERDSLGLSRVVLSQPTAYGFDNSLLLEGLCQLGEAGRGIVVIHPDIADAELDHLHALGVRGVRFMLFAGGVLDWAAVEPIARRVARVGWHLKFQLDGRRFAELAPTLAGLPVRSVIDLHLGSFPADVDADSAAADALCRGLDDDWCWVSLSAPYPIWPTLGRAPEVLLALPRRAVATRPDRCIWSSNWPHVNVSPTPLPRAGLDWLERVIPDAAQRCAVLEDNPGSLFGPVS